MKISSAERAGASHPGIRLRPYPGVDAYAVGREQTGPSSLGAGSPGQGASSQGKGSEGWYDGQQAADRLRRSIRGRHAGDRYLSSQYRGHGVAREIARRCQQEYAGAARDKRKRPKCLLHVRVLGELVQLCCQVGDQQLPPGAGNQLGLAGEAGKLTGEPVAEPAWPARRVTVVMRRLSAAARCPAS